MLRPDQIIRSKRKRISIIVDGFGRVIVRAPLRCAQSQIDDFIAKSEAWILRKQAERKGAGVQLPPENLHGYVFPLLGKDTRIYLTAERRIRYDKDENVLYLPQKDARDRLVKWLKENARRILERVTSAQAERMGVRYQALSIGSARTRWGTCTAENDIRYTFRLLYCPREIIEYVVVHELSHIRHKNHSKAFWQEVERYLPDWKEKRKWLKAHGVYAKIF